jgi:hypothetical protein
VIKEPTRAHAAEIRGVRAAGAQSDADRERRQRDEGENDYD